MSLDNKALTFADYHRTVIGFHGTTAQIAADLVAGQPFNASENDDEWLGKGIYFWEYAPKQAWWWTRKKKLNPPAVVGAIIRLGCCFDLLDPTNLRILKNFGSSVIDKYKHAGREVPKNVRIYKKFDCAVFNHYYETADIGGVILDSVRGVYVPTDNKKRIFEASWLYENVHIQINVRNPKNILAVWHVRPDGRYGT